MYLCDFTYGLECMFDRWIICVDSLQAETRASALKGVTICVSRKLSPQQGINLHVCTQMCIPVLKVSDYGYQMESALLSIL